MCEKRVKYRSTLVYLPLVNLWNSLICQNYKEGIRPHYKTTRYTANSSSAIHQNTSNTNQFSYCSLIRHFKQTCIKPHDRRTIL